MLKRDSSKLADSFELHGCDDPRCGPHIFGLDAQGRIMCEIVVAPDHAVEFIAVMQKLLYEKAVEKFK